MINKINTPKQFYKHYKGGIYEVISFNVRVVYDLPNNLYYDEHDYEATFEHNLDKVLVYTIGDSYLVPSDSTELYSTAFVLYKSVTKGEYWLRPFNDFMGTIEPFTDKSTLRFRRLHEYELLENDCIK